MIDFLGTLLALAVSLSILIAVHEFGHFWVARRLGVKVLRFSIGFGRVLWSRKSGVDGTEYAVSALPLGGYVKMLDEREGEVADHELHRAFNRQPVYKRTAVVFAGPLFNFLFAVLAYWLMFIAGVSGIKPLVGEVAPETPAARAGMERGQMIVAVGGEPTPTWSAVFEQLLPAALRGESAAVVVETQSGDRRTLHVELGGIGSELGPGELPQRLGVQPFRPPLPPIVDEVTEGSPAAEAGLRSGDRVVAADGQPIDDWEQLVDVVRAHPDEQIELVIRRGGQRLPLNVRPAAVETEEGSVGRMGASVRIDTEMMERLRAEQRYGPLVAVGKAVSRTWEMSALTLRMLWEMLVGRASTENISGPITIAVYAKASALAGFAQFFAFLAIVSLSLGVLNLLPIPILDGGHLLYYAIEVIKGKPLSEEAEAVGQKIGLALILALMSLAFYNDLARLVQ